MTIAWKQSQADAEEAKAEAIELAITRLEDVQGLYAESSERRHQLRSFIDSLRLDAENFRAQASLLRAPREPYEDE